MADGPPPVPRVDSVAAAGRRLPLVENPTYEIVLTLRIVCEAAAMAGPLIVWVYRRPTPAPTSEPTPQVNEGMTRASRIPLVANALAILLFFSCLWGPFGLSFLPLWALLALAASGLGVGIAGLILLLAARGVLGDSWSFAPKASQKSGLATSGPYGWVRHPIYLGMAVLFFGAALAFANWLAILLVFLLILPTLVWRATVEERLLVRVFGDQYVAYRFRTRMIIPCVRRRSAPGPQRGTVAARAVGATGHAIDPPTYYGN